MAWSAGRSLVRDVAWFEARSARGGISGARQASCCGCRGRRCHAGYETSQDHETNRNTAASLSLHRAQPHPSLIFQATSGVVGVGWGIVVANMGAPVLALTTFRMWFSCQTGTLAPAGP